MRFGVLEIQVAESIVQLQANRMEYVVLDIETTGLDVANSAIIEVGALLISGDEIKERYTSFVRYDGKLPDTTKRITGITDSMLEGAPAIGEVVEQLKKFIQKRPVIAHNGYSFDFRMLEREGMRFTEKYDSMEIAFFVLPTNAMGHGTSALAEFFSLGKVPHRALPDCEIEFAILQGLRDIWSKKSRKKIAALKFFAERTGWWWANFLTGKSEEIVDISTLVEAHVPYRKKDAEQNKLVLTRPIDLPEVEKSFSPGAGMLEYSEDRPEQRSMARFIAEAFNEKRHAVVEAGTGVGKSKAYLVPSVLFSIKNDIPVVISTFTKALQDQLAFKEIKHVRDTLKPDLRVAVIKGKQNYVCLDKFREFTQEALTELSQRSLYEHAEDETRFTTRLAFLLLSAWILETERGDWDELPYWLTERIPKRVKEDICNLDELCTKGVCELFDAEKCFLRKARLRAKDADLVIMNHAILLTGLRRKVVQREEPIESEEVTTIEEIGFSHPILPTEAKFVVFDEVHHLEDAATSAWTLTLSQYLLERLMHQLYDKRRGVRTVMDAIIGGSPDSRLPELGVIFDGIEKDLRLDVRILFDEHLEKLVPRDPSSKWDIKVSFSELSQTPERMKALTGLLENIKQRLVQIETILNDFSQRTTNDKLKKSLSIRADLTSRLVKTIDGINGDSDYFVRFLERSNSTVQIHAAPLSVAQEMKFLVYDTFNSVVMTSATITVDDKFNFFARRCGTNLIDDGHVKYLQRPSSFDYSRQVQFFVPRGISYGSAREVKRRHAQQCLDFLKEAIVASQGGSLVLCSSHEQVDWLYEGLAEHLSRRDIWLLRQPKDSGVTSVIRDFTNDINSVLIGTAKLWQGVDVPGASLRSLFIYKIPYKVPTDPMIKARCDEIQREGGDSYSSYYEPLTALDLKQGFGRLIRKKTDMGIAVLLDEKIMKKDTLLKSFPPGVKIVPAEPAQIFSALSELAKTVDVGQLTDGEI